MYFIAESGEEEGGGRVIFTFRRERGGGKGSGGALKEEGVLEGKGFRGCRKKKKGKGISLSFREGNI